MVNASVGAGERPKCSAILVVEDDPAIRETIGTLLDLEGYKIFTASNGQEGLDLLPTIPKPCLILLDLMMPVMNGWKFAEAIEKDVILASIPVVVVSAFTEKATTIRSKAIVKKPVDFEILLHVVKQWCGEGSPS